MAGERADWPDGEMARLRGLVDPPPLEAGWSGGWGWGGAGWGGVGWASGAE